MQIPAASVEYVTVTITSDVALDAQAVQIAVIARGVGPTDADWQTAAWTGDAGTTRKAQILYNGDRAAGSYDVWTKVTDTPEVPIRKAGVLTLLA